MLKIFVYLNLWYVVDDVQEEIECLYEFVPEVGEHFEIVDKIGEGKQILNRPSDLWWARVIVPWFQYGPSLPRQWAQWAHPF